MKKRAKKLVLAKETIQELGARAALVAGGITNTGCSGETSASCDYTCTWNNTAYVLEPQSGNC
jgi:hypothetical protein